MRENDRGDLSIRLRGARLRRLRIKRGFRTQGALAQVLGCARSTVATWEASSSIPRPYMLVRLCVILRVPPGYLIEEPGGPSLRSLRTAAGKRQSDMAGALNVAATYYCDVENGRQAIPKRWFPILASVFGIPVAALREILAPGRDDTGREGAPWRRPRRVNPPRPSP